jgi:hypothetical protein
VRREKLGQHGIYPWFPKTISQLKEYIEAKQSGYGNMLVETLCFYSLVQCFELPFAGPKCGVVSEAGWTFNKSSCLGARYTILVSKKVLRVVR